MNIYPSIIAQTTEESKKVFNHIASIATSVHIDIMDGKFVTQTSMLCDFSFPVSCQIHLMVANPIEWVQKNPKKGDFLYAHIETLGNPQEFIDLCKSQKKKVGFALNPQTSVDKVKKYFDQIDGVLLMTVEPGQYGGEFNEECLDKISQINVPVTVDGGVNENTIELVAKKGASGVVVGSYFQNAINVTEALQKLEEKI